MQTYSRYWSCPKCASGFHTVHYLSVTDLMQVTCGQCGYQEEKLPKDASK